MAQTIQRSFTSGELAPSLRARADLAKYTAGLAQCENFIVRAQGGAYSRPGTRFVGEVAASASRARLIPFSFNVEQTYILVFENLQMQVIMDGAYVETSPGVRFTLVTPYTTAQLPRLQFTQSADVMTIVHPDHDTRSLSRTAHTAWTLTVDDFATGVAAPTWAASVNATITGITQANPAVVSAVNTYANGDVISISGVVGMTEVNGRSFKLANVTGASFELEGEDSTGYTAYGSGGVASRATLTTVGTGAGTNNKRYSYVITAVDANGVESLASTTGSLDTPSLSTTAGINLSWSPVAAASYYRIYKDPTDYSGVFGWIGDSNTTSFNDFNVAPITSDAPPIDNQPFAGVGNKPSTVGYYQQRRVFANTLNKPQTVFATQTANYLSLRSSNPSRDDDAIEFTIASRQVNEIRHLMDVDGLLMLTSGGAWRVTEGQDLVLTPSTIGVKQSSYHGSSWVTPVVVGDSAVYVQEKGARIRDLKYQWNADKYQGSDLSITAEHIFQGNTVEEMSYAEEPHSIIWMIRDDGVLVGLTYMRDHEVFAWHRHVTAGSFESVATISEDGRDATYVIVNRTIGAATVRYVERIEPRLFLLAEDCFCVDSGLSYNGAPATVISGLTHLEGEDVAVLADGNEIAGLTVASGQITLPIAASKVHVGLPYTCTIDTLDLDITSEKEALRGKEVSVSEVLVEVESSRGGWVGPIADPTGADDTTDADMLEIKPRFTGDAYDAIALKSYKQSIIINPEWNLGGGIRIQQRAPLPLTILSVMPEVTVGG